jgi:hypothetical protein
MEGHHPRRHDNVGGYLTTSPPAPPPLPPSLPLSDVDFLIPSEIDHAYIYILKENSFHAVPSPFFLETMEYY